MLQHSVNEMSLLSYILQNSAGNITALPSHGQAKEMLTLHPKRQIGRHGSWGRWKSPSQIKDTSHSRPKNSHPPHPGRSPQTHRLQWFSSGLDPKLQAPYHTMATTHQNTPHTGTSTWRRQWCWELVNGTRGNTTTMHKLLMNSLPDQTLRNAITQVDFT